MENHGSKPPLLAWLTRLSFELFGAGVISARMIIVAFSALFITVIALIGQELRQDRRYAVTAGIIALSTLAIAIHGRILLPDIPTAAFSALGFYFLLLWIRTNRNRYVAAMVFSLSAGFLTKGPVVGVVFGSGLIALLVRPTVRSTILRNWRVFALSMALFVCLTAPWFFDAYWTFLMEASAVFDSEIKARRLGGFSLDALVQLLPLSMPWTFFLVFLVSRRNFRIHAESREYNVLLLAWLALSILPFLFIRSFDPYLVGSLIPIALLVATPFHQSQPAATDFLRG